VTLQPFGYLLNLCAPQTSSLSCASLLGFMFALTPRPLEAFCPRYGMPAWTHDSAECHRDVWARCRSVGDVDVLLLDKTGTITLETGLQRRFLSGAGVDEHHLADAGAAFPRGGRNSGSRSIVRARERTLQPSWSATFPRTLQPSSHSPRQSQDVWRRS